MMVFARALAGLAVVGCLLLGHASTSRADVALFGSFNQTEPGTPFTFDAATGTMSGTADVTFNFVNQPAIDATCVITMTTTQAVDQVAHQGGDILIVRYDTIDVAVTAKAPIGGMTNLLTMHAANGGGFAEPVGGMTLDVGGQASSPSLVFTSDFMTFGSGGSYGAFTIGLIADAGVMRDPVTGFLTTDDPANGVLRASVNSQFSIGAPPSVPEPSSAALVVVGLLAVPAILSRDARRRKSQAGA
jgi:hypothetical protein